MQMDDMILVSIDDHFIEPPDMYKNHVPTKWADQVPKVVRNAKTGIDEWIFQGEAASTPFGMAATVSLLMPFASTLNESPVRVKAIGARLMAITSPSASL